MSCPSSSYRSVEGVCQPCSWGCHKCYQAAYCLACKQHFHLSKGTCSYVVSLPSGVVTVVLVIVVVAILLLSVLIFVYIPYLKRKRAKEQLQSKKLVSPFRVLKKYSDEIVNYTLPEEQPQTITTCPLCLKSSVDAETHCGHRFHEACLLEWMAMSECCPSCKDCGVYPVKVLCLQCGSSYESREREGSESGKDLSIRRCRVCHSAKQESCFT